VCVYCASHDAALPRWGGLARELGSGLAARGWEVVYGGGSTGLMGELARSALAGGSKVTGFIPEALATREVAATFLTQLVQVPTLRERKQRMDAASDAFVVMPGGIGTLEELLEIATLRQLGYHDRPVVVLDPDGFFDPLFSQFDRMVEAGLTDSPSVAAVQRFADVDDGLEALAGAVRPGPAGASSPGSPPDGGVGPMSR